MEEHKMKNDKTLTLITIVKCWDDPQATTDKTKRTRMLVDYMYTDKQAGQLDYRSAMDHYPMFGWSIEYRAASSVSSIVF